MNKNLLDSADKVTKDKLVQQLKQDLDNYKYILIYGVPSNLPSEQVVYDTLQLPKGVITEFVDDAAKETFKRLFAFGAVKKADGSVHVDSYYATPGSDLTNLDSQLEFITFGFKKAMGMKDYRINQFNDENKVKPQDVINDPDYTKSENFDYGSYGKYQSTGYFERMGYSSYSLWDAKYSDTTTAGYGMYSDSWWTVDELVTRSSVERFNAEEIVDHGPTTTNSGSQAQVNLTWGAPTVGWSWTLNDVDTIDDYHGGLMGYRRWIFDYYKTSNASKYSYKTEPGARFKNTVGAMAIDTSHSILYWDYLWGTTNRIYTGTYTYSFPDR
ncbi:hypothetical protein [Effusibacillus consociatus]|uniref:Uncharacterized protein n=1 Tax=Effusibacillus consociatus TaxID=1117041 RepID=A0ABV9Q2P8_9BACL